MGTGVAEAGQRCPQTFKAQPTGTCGARAAAHVSSGAVKADPGAGAAGASDSDEDFRVVAAHFSNRTVHANGPIDLT